MTNPITNRIAARITHLQIERILRAETIADRLGKSVEKALEKSLGAATRPEDGKKLDELLDIFAGIPDTLIRIAESDFQKIGVWSHRQSARVFAKTIPRKWWRKVDARVALVEKLEVPALPELDGAEPVTGKRMTSEEWELWVQKNILPPPSPDVVTEVLQRTTNGVGWRERISGLSRLVDPERTAASLISGYAEGLNVDEMTQRILPHVKGQVKSSARRIARTESLRIANEMQRESYKDLGPLMVGTQVLASLDENTRAHHALRHGRIYYSDGRYPSADLLPVLPDEPNCRCFDVPVMKPPEGMEKDPEVLAAFANASKEIIPDPVVYSQWFAGASEGKQKLAVGARRLSAMKSRLGNTRPPEWTDFVDGQGKLLSPSYLKNENDTDRLLRRGALRQTMDARSVLIRKIRTASFT